MQLGEVISRDMFNSTLSSSIDQRNEFANAEALHHNRKNDYIIGGR